uniref:tRNA Ile-lysidine synthetase n=1 Tax=Pyropia seriata TaxID=79731 RepID=UPI00286ABEBF|nr:tRNA Ile-lysidine synthetase [Neoporphyra seriata]WKD84144.1 tRNA Ile-lysidine synthetase [Neoporphyra seriata]
MLTNSFLHKKFISTIETRQLLPYNSSLLVSFSGGQDSLTLLKILLDLKKFYNWKISLIHFDHRWRSDSMVASKQVFRYAKRCNLSLHYFECPKYLNTEESSRKWRYATLINTASINNLTKIVLAHTATDKAETVLSNLFRGASLDGLSSIRWSSKISNSVHLVRPLLNFYRSETTWFCRKYFLPVWIDQSNYNYALSRNRLRQELIPYIKSFFQPQFEEKSYVLSSLIALDVDFLEQEALRIYSLIQHKDLLAINYLIIKLLHPSIQSRILKLFFVSHLDLNPTSKQISDMIFFINQGGILKNINIKNYIFGADGIWLYIGIKQR